MRVRCRQKAIRTLLESLILYRFHLNTKRNIASIKRELFLKSINNSLIHNTSKNMSNSIKSSTDSIRETKTIRVEARGRVKIIRRRLTEAHLRAKWHQALLATLLGMIWP